MSLDYGEILCEAMSLVAEKTAQKLGYDVTKLYTIIDDTQKSKRRYTVTDGMVTFTVFSTSEEEYKKDEQVYVCIPGGDFSQQKLIVSRKNDEGDKPYSYLTPFDDYVDLEAWECPDVVGLVANMGKDYKNIKIFEHEYEKPVSGYSRMGLRAEFLTQFDQSQVIKGEYGLILKVYINDDAEPHPFVFDVQDMIGNPYGYYLPSLQEIVFNIEDFDKINKIECYLYQLNNFYTMDNEYVLPSFIETTQSGEEFWNLKEEDKQQIIDANKNIFVKNINVSFGIDKKEVKDETLKLYTSDSFSYKRNYTPEEINTKLTKTVELRWIHKNSDGSMSVIRNYSDILNNEEVKKIISQYDFCWYKYRYGAPISDKYGGMHWERINKYLKLYNLENQVKYYLDEGIEYNEELKNYYHKYSEASEEDRIKYSIEAQGEINKIECSDNKYIFQTNLFLKDTNIKYPPLFSYTFTPDANYNQEERVKVVLVKYGEEFLVTNSYESSPIIFYNEDDVVSQISNQAMYGLVLSPDDKSEGNYYIYDLANNSLRTALNDNDKNLKCYFKSDNSDNLAELKEFESIKWTIPRESTMLNFDSIYSKKYYTEEQLKVENMFETSENAGANNYVISFGEIYGIVDKNGLVSTYKKYVSENSQGEIQYGATELPYYINALASTSTNLELVPNPNITVLPTSLQYGIKNLLNLSHRNNSIKCIVKKDNKDFQKIIDFQFGHMSSGGSGVTLALRFDTTEGYSDTLTTRNMETETENQIKIIAELYSTTGEKITNLEEIKFDFRLQNPYNSFSDSNIELSTNKNICIVKKKKDIDLFDNSTIDIVECEVTGFGNCSLINQVGIKLLNNDLEGNNYTKAIGPDKIIYSTDGQASYDKDPYYLLNNNNEIVYPMGLSWRIITELDNPKEEDVNSTEFDAFLPKIIVPQEIEEIEMETPIANLSIRSLYTVEYKEYQADEIRYIDKTDSFYIDNEEGKAKYEKYSHMFQSSEKQGDYTKRIYRYLLPEERDWKLEVPNITLENIPKIAVQAYSNIGGIEYIYYQMPIIIIHNSWFSSVIDSWDGEIFGITEEEGQSGRIMSKTMLAGTKNADNKFSGVMIGDWGAAAQSGESNSQEIITNTGIYGFHEGKMSFYFKDDGTAAIGKAGQGQILFDGTQGTIQSKNYKDSNLGMFMDYTKGIIKVEGKNGTIILDGSADNEAKSEGNVPLAIGKNFKVDWDGNLFANDGTFSGSIRGANIDFSNLYIDIQSYKGGRWETIIYGGVEANDEEQAKREEYSFKNMETYVFWSYESSREKGDYIYSAEAFDQIRNQKVFDDSAQKWRYQNNIAIYKTELEEAEGNENIKFRKMEKENDSTKEYVLGHLGFVGGELTSNIGIQTTLTEGYDKKYGIMFDSATNFKAQVAPSGGIYLQVGDSKHQLLMTHNSIKLIGYEPEEMEGFYARFG